MKSTEQDLTIGVFGCGNIAKIAWAPNFQDAGVRTLFFDIDAAKAQAFADSFGGQAFATPEALLAERPHGCVVATWAPTHFEVASMVLKAGSHLLVEKPMTTELADAKKLVRDAYARDLPIAQPFHQLLMAAPMLEAVREGRLGDLSSLAYEWLRFKPSNENLLEDLGPHAIALILSIVPFAEISAVSAYRHEEIVGTLLKPKKAIEYHVALLSPFRTITVRIGSGMRIDYSERVPLQLTGSKAVLMGDLRTTQTRTDWQCSYRPAIVTTSHRSDPGGPVGPKVEQLRLVRPIEDVRAQQAQQWLDSLRGGPMLPVNGLRGLRVQAVLDAATQSLARGGTPVVPDPLTDGAYGSD